MARASLGGFVRRRADGGGHAHAGAGEPVRDGVVHGLVRECFAAFAEQMQEGGRSLPRYVVAGFEGFVRCGVLACGFMRARCAGCGHDRLVAFWLQVIGWRRARLAVPTEGERSDDAMEGVAPRGGRTRDLRAGRRGEGTPGGRGRRGALAPMGLSSCGLVAELDGFNLHAGVCVAADDRDASNGSAATWRGPRWRAAGWSGSMPTPLSRVCAIGSPIS